MDGSKPLAAILVSARRRQLAILDSRSRLRIFWEKFIKPLNFLTLIFSSENCLSLFFKIQINWIVHFNKFNLNDDYNWLRYVLFCYVFYTCPYTSSHKISTVVRQPKLVFWLNPAPADIVFFSLDYVSLGTLQWISGGYQVDILEHFEKFKMAAGATGNHNS